MQNSKILLKEMQQSLETKVEKTFKIVGDHFERNIKILFLEEYMLN